MRRLVFISVLASFTVSCFKETSIETHEPVVTILIRR